MSDHNQSLHTMSQDVYTRVSFCYARAGTNLGTCEARARKRERHVEQPAEPITQQTRVRLWRAARRRSGAEARQPSCGPNHGNQRSKQCRSIVQTPVGYTPS